jgi:hypothetical protein
MSKENTTVKKEDAMENTDEGREIAHRVAKQFLTELIPLSHLALDVDEPIEGWESFFVERGIEIVTDDVGRRSVSREVLAELLAEQREHEARVFDRPELDRAPVGVGIPALDEDATAFESMMAAGRVSPQEEFGQFAKPRFLEEQIEAGARQAAAARAEVARRKEAR